MRRVKQLIKRTWNTEHSPPMVMVESVGKDLWRVVVFEKSSQQGWGVAEIIECADPAHWVSRMWLPEDTILHDSISNYHTGRAKKLSSRIARIVQQKSLE